MLWILFAIFAAACVLWILLPLRHHQAHHDQAHHDQAHHNKFAMLAVMTFIPLGALVIYLFSGAPQIDGAPQAERLAADNLPPVALAAKIENHLAQNTGDSKGWHLLAALYMALGNYPQAEEAYQRARALIGDEPPLLTGQAQAIIFQNRGVISQRADQLLKRAWQKAPNDLATLYFLGEAARQDTKKSRARQFWRKALQQARKQKDKEWQDILQRKLADSK